MEGILKSIDWRLDFVHFDFIRHESVNEGLCLKLVKYKLNKLTGSDASSISKVWMSGY